MATEPGTKDRPNSLWVLAVMRDDDFSDPWGTAMQWAGSACDVMWDADPNEVPHEMGYSPGMGGPEVPNGSAEPHHITLADLSYATVTIWCWLHDLDADTWDGNTEDLPYWEEPAFRERAGELRRALLCLHRYIDWCVRAGRDY